ncbi:MAG TPA: type II toxin-antitoxin system VapB family antitoxin [Jiangellaceae bacterium]|jgi:antitoxin VapB|nr:type II toxin-antitoxin system VapB family antitoxin [Jiangellaceae bacterium]
MPLSIKSEEADRLARELAATTGESLTEAVLVSLRDRLERERARRRPAIASRLRALSAELRGMPVHDIRSADEIIGYDERGLPR